MTKEEIIKKVHHYYSQQLIARHITTQKVTEFNEDINRYNNCVEDINQRLKIKLKNGGICSKILIKQLAKHNCQLGELYSNQNLSSNFEFIEFYNSSEILDIIELIEIGSKQGEQFKHTPLQRLYKIHHNSFSGTGYSLILNIKNYWFNKTDKLIKKREKEFQEIIEKVGINNLPLILHSMHDKAIYSRELTGEWIIYTKYNKINYYLCLALHNEGDTNIFENKIKYCYTEFPELIPAN